MSHILHVTCHKCYMSQISSCKQFSNDPVCCIFLESLWKIQFNGHDKNVSCHMCNMSHVTYVIFKNINLQTILPKVQCVIYFWKAHAKYSLMVVTKTLHVTYVTCHITHMLHVTNIKLQTILPKTQCIIYFWKSPGKYSSIIMIKTLHINCSTCYTCYM